MATRVAVHGGRGDGDDGVAKGSCSGAASFPVNASGVQCHGLQQASTGDRSTDACAKACCADIGCDTWQLETSDGSSTTSKSSFTISRASCRSVPPNTRRCSAHCIPSGCAYDTDADWCLPSDGVPDSRLSGICWIGRASEGVGMCGPPKKGTWIGGQRPSPPPSPPSPPAPPFRNATLVAWSADPARVVPADSSPAKVTCILHTCTHAMSLPPAPLFLLLGAVAEQQCGGLVGWRGGRVAEWQGGYGRWVPGRWWVRWLPVPSVMSHAPVYRIAMLMGFHFDIRPLSAFDADQIPY